MTVLISGAGITGPTARLFAGMICLADLVIADRILAARKSRAEPKVC